jgi:hypothetical protein
MDRRQLDRRRLRRSIARGAFDEYAKGRDQALDWPAQNRNAQTRDRSPQSRRIARKIECDTGEKLGRIALGFDPGEGEPGQAGDRAQTRGAQIDRAQIDRFALARHAPPRDWRRQEAERGR